MPGLPDALAEAAREWVEKAENDLRAAAQILELGADAPTDAACFHAQQCVEKYLKAALVLNGIDFQKVHDVHVLVERLPLDARPALDVVERRRLTDYATSTRSPGDYEEIGLAEARAAVRLARRVRRELRRTFPRALLRPRRRR